jgi:hypothetical protein
VSQLFRYPRNFYLMPSQRLGCQYSSAIPWRPLPLLPSTRKHGNTILGTPARQRGYKEYQVSQDVLLNSCCGHLPLMDAAKDLSYTLASSEPRWCHCFTSTETRKSRLVSSINISFVCFVGVPLESVCRDAV